MRGLIKFTAIPNVELINSRQQNLAEGLADKIFNLYNYGSIGAYLMDLISIEKFHHTIAADYEVIKYFDLGSSIFLSANDQDWYDGQTLIDSWFMAEHPEFYKMDLNCEVINRSVIGNYFVLTLSVLDIGNIIYT